MLLRIAAWCSAAFLAAVPASAGIETGAVADARASATAIAIEVPLSAGSVPSFAYQASDGAKPEDTNDKPAVQPPALIAPVRANDAAASQSTAHLDTQADTPRQDQTEAKAPPKLAALEPPGTNVPAAASPHPELPGSNLPHIDAALRFNVLPVSTGGVLTKWNAVRAAMRAESDVFARCRSNMDSCPAAAKRFLAIVDQGRAVSGRARIGVINRAVNLAIEAVSDMAQWGVPDRWSPPLETFTTGKGDCEDYAIAKYVALIEAGFAAEDVKLMIVRNTAANEDHAVTAARLDGTWIILDNRWLRLVEDTAMPQAVPRFALGSDGVQQFVPDVLIGARPAPPAPASIVN